LPCKKSARFAVQTQKPGWEFSVKHPKHPERVVSPAANSMNRTRRMLWNLHTSVGYSVFAEFVNRKIEAIPQRLKD